jgi:hypothetical protein
VRVQAAADDANLLRNPKPSHPRLSRPPSPWRPQTNREHLRVSQPVCMMQYGVRYTRPFNATGMTRVDSGFCRLRDTPSHRSGDIAIAIAMLTYVGRVCYDAFLCTSQGSQILPHPGSPSNLLRPCHAPSLYTRRRQPRWATVTCTGHHCLHDLNYRTHVPLHWRRMA